MEQMHDPLFSLLSDNKLKVTNNLVNRINDFYFQQKFHAVARRIVNNEAEYNFFDMNTRKALEEARKNNLRTARALLDRSEAFINQPEHEMEVLIFGAVKHPIGAYLLYKEGKFEEAEQLSYRTMADDSVLEQEYPIFFFHKMQQLNNIVRIYFRIGNTAEGMFIVRNILDCLIFDTTFTYGDVTFKTHSDEESRKLKPEMVFQIFFELAQYLNHRKIFDNHLLEAFNDFASREIFSPDLRGIIEWMLLKEKIATGDSNTLSCFKNFLVNSGNFYSLDPLYNVLNSALHSTTCNGELRTVVEKFIEENYD